MRKIRLLVLAVAFAAMISFSSTALAHMHAYDEGVGQVQGTEEETDIYIYYDQYGNVINMEKEPGISTYASCFIHQWEKVYRYNTNTGAIEYNYKCSGCNGYYYGSWIAV